MAIHRKMVQESAFNNGIQMPFNLRKDDIRLAMQDVYDFFYDVNKFLVERRLPRLEDTLRKQILSGVISDMLTESIAKHSRSLTPNRYHNGHPDLIVTGTYSENKVKSGSEGMEIKTTMKRGGAVDMHGARTQWLLVFVYAVDLQTEPAIERAPLRFQEIYCAFVMPDDFRRNDRGELGTRTATLDRDGLIKLRNGWLYLDRD